MKRAALILLCLSVLMASCRHRLSQSALLSRIDSLSKTAPQIAYDSLARWEAFVSSRPEAERMRFTVLKAAIEAARTFDSEAYRIKITPDIVKALEYYEHHGTPQEKVEALNAASNYYSSVHNDPQALTLLLRAEEICHSDSLHVSPYAQRQTYVSLCSFYRWQGNLQAALIEAQKRYHLPPSRKGDSVFRLQTLKELYQQMGNNKEADLYLDEAMNVLSLQDRKERSPFALIAQTLYYCEKKNKTMADSCMRMFHVLTPEVLPKFQFLKAIYFTHFNSPDSAIYYWTAVRNSRAADIDLDKKESAAFHLFQLFKNVRKNYEEATRHATDLLNIKDSIESIHNIGQTVNAYNHFNYERSIRQEAELKQKNLQTKIILLGVLAALLAVALISVLLRRRYRLQLTRTERKVKSLEQQLLERMERNKGQAMPIAEVYAVFKDAANYGITFKDAGIWKELYDSVDHEYPHFGEQMQTVNERLQRDDINLCYLIRLGLSQAEIARLRHVAPSTISRRYAAIRKML